MMNMQRSVNPSGWHSHSRPGPADRPLQREAGPVVARRVIGTEAHLEKKYGLNIVLIEDMNILLRYGKVA